MTIGVDQPGEHLETDASTSKLTDIRNELISRPATRDAKLAKDGHDPVWRATPRLRVRKVNVPGFVVGFLASPVAEACFFHFGPERVEYLDIRVGDLDAAYDAAVA